MTKSITEQKKELRKFAKSWRTEAVGLEALRSASQAVAATSLLVLANKEYADVTIAGFASMPDELDTTPLLVALNEQGFKLALPVIEGKNQPLIFRSWIPGDKMASATWGIREPLPDQPEVLPDIAFVPLLAFDKKGYRLGYGGGFYDRTLAKIRDIKPVLAIGLAFDEQEVDAVPYDSYDQRLDLIFTQTRALHCTE